MHSRTASVALVSNFLSLVFPVGSVFLELRAFELETVRTPYECRDERCFGSYLRWRLNILIMYAERHCYWNSGTRFPFFDLK